MNISNELKLYLKGLGCNIFGFADLRCLAKEVRQNFDYGILIALSFSKEAMINNKNNSPQKYYDELNPMTKRLKNLAQLTEQYLVDKGYKALAKITSTVVSDEDFRTVLPHKTVATLAGVGWIGKCALLVTKEVGSALRMVVVLTNAPLECGTPVVKSKCSPNCTVCVDICPGKAPLGGLWEAGTDRNEFFDANACSIAAHKRGKELLDVDETLCGLCMANCPFTQRGLGY